jgi:hypothetical protein
MSRLPVPARSFLILGLLAIGFPAAADEQKISLGDLPKAVLGAVKARFPGAELREASKETEKGKTIYEVSLKDKGVAVDAALTGEGKFVEVERTIDPKALPRAVAAAVGGKYPKATVRKAEEVIKFEGAKGSKSFEVVLKTEAGKTMEVKLSPEGKVLEEESEDD